VAVVGELDLFARALARPEARAPGLRAKVLAITGTNGKTTVTSLTGLLVAARRPERGRGRQHRPDAAGTC
jgi:UDP-N-acetylmuramoylalanine-D-glutamate ligase